jgi:hypothetical protein
MHAFLVWYVILLVDLRRGLANLANCSNCRRWRERRNGKTLAVL